MTGVLTSKRVNHAQWLQQLLENDPIYQSLLKRRYHELYNEAQRILKTGYVKWIETGSDGRLYYVAPILYKVRELSDGRWLCQCENWSRYGTCPHVIAVQVKEGE